VNYVLDGLHLLIEKGHAVMDCKPEAHDAYNAWVDAGNQQRVWGVSTVNSWYRNEFGRSAQNWPFSLLEFWRQTRTVDPTAYDYT
jgi:4-hydroxyacetophenone monooxygenase